jgi:mRNA interferase RelE/StbE
MSYQVIIPKAVQKQLDKVSPDFISSLISAIMTLGENPRSPNSLKMNNVQGYRLRVGNYRVLYDIDDLNQKVILRRVAHRKDIYRS